LIRAGVALGLRVSGLRAVEASCADEALTLLDAMGAEIDLVVSDVKMSGAHDGIDLANLLSSKTPSTPIILMAGFAGGREWPSGVPVLYKPFQYVTLANVVFLSLGLSPAVN
jgi:DNA-binding NtrC family response regulator